VGDKPLPVLSDVHLGLARICYEWNDLNTALQYAESSLELAQLYDNTIDRFIVCEIFLSRIKLAMGEVKAASSLLAKTAQSVHQSNLLRRLPELAAQQILTLIKRGELEAAAEIADKHNLPLSQARVLLARKDISSTLEILEPLYQQVEAKDRNNDKLKLIVLNAVALYLHGKKENAVQLLVNVLTLTEPEDCIRIYVDEGLPMFSLLSEINTQRIKPDYIARILSAFKTEKKYSNDKTILSLSQPLIDPLSQRELEVLQLITEGLTNREIGERLFIALDTVKGHNRRIFDKLNVENRAQAIKKARNLKLLSSN
jgi:LuxR family maltose regulon positive regulatory protein